MLGRGRRVPELKFKANAVSVAGLFRPASTSEKWRGARECSERKAEQTGYVQAAGYRPGKKGTSVRFFLESGMGRDVRCGGRILEV
jgi:hypothetical protein